MAHQTDHLFARKHPLIPSAVGICVLLDNGEAALPSDTFRTWEQVLEKLVLAAKVHVDVTGTEAGWLVRLNQVPVFANSSRSVLMGQELDVAVHGLGGRTLHDDMNGATALVRDHLGVTANEMDDLLLGDSIRDLEPSQHNMGRTIRQVY